MHMRGGDDGRCAYDFGGLACQLAPSHSLLYGEAARLYSTLFKIEIWSRFRIAEQFCCDRRGNTGNHARAAG